MYPIPRWISAPNDHSLPLRVRLALTYLLVTLAGLLLLGGGFRTLAHRSLAEQRSSELVAQTELYAALLSELASSTAQLQALITAAPGRDLLPPGVAVRIFALNGVLLAGDTSLGPFPSREALVWLRPSLPLPASQVAGRSYAARPIIGPSGSLAVLELSRDGAAEAQLLARLDQLIVQAALVAALIMALVSAMIARSLAHPVVAHTKQAQALAARIGASSPLTPLHRDELVALGQSLDQLERGLSAYLARINQLEQARSQFYRGVSHELRTPLAALGGALENLADRLPPTERTAIPPLEAEIARLQRMVDELLRPPDEDQIQLGARTAVDLSTLANDVVALLAGRARRAGVGLQALTEAPVQVWGDRDRLKQALINLVDNALRVSPVGGAVRILVEYAGAQAILAVEDDGPGVAPDERTRIWQRGVRGADPALAGSAGLGLALVYAVTLAHGGTADLDPHYEGGARFVISLPALERTNP